MTNIGTLFAFVLVCIGVVILRYTKPNQLAIPASVHAGRPHSGHADLPRLNELSPMGDLDSIVVWTAIGIVVYMDTA